MSTHGAVNFINHRNEVIASLLRTSDGGPSYFGRQLFDYFKDWKVSNGTLHQPKHSNGMGCFAATVVATFKTDEGEFHLIKPVLAYDYDFTYNIFQLKEGGPLRISVIEDNATKDGKVLFTGFFSNMGKWLDEEYGPSPFVTFLTSPQTP
jgi:hypothetical protein